MLRSLTALAADGTPVSCHLDCPGPPFLNDLGAGRHIYLLVEDGAEEWNRVWGIFEIARLAEVDSLEGYVGQGEDGSLELRDDNGRFSWRMNGEVMRDIVAWAQHGGTPLDYSRGRPSALSA